MVIPFLVSVLLLSLVEGRSSWLVTRGDQLQSQVDLIGDIKLPHPFLFDHEIQLDIEKANEWWIWKPKAIIDALNKMEMGDTILYLDEGCDLDWYISQS